MQLVVINARLDVDKVVYSLVGQDKDKGCCHAKLEITYTTEHDPQWKLGATVTIWS